jgi:hypothetical protein
MLKATEVALRKLRRPEDVSKARGKTIAEVLPLRAQPSDGSGAARGTDERVVVQPESGSPAAAAAAPAEAAAPVETPGIATGADQPAAQPPVRDSGPVEGVRGNREVPPGREQMSGRVAEGADEPVVVDPEAKTES